MGKIFAPLYGHEADMAKLADAARLRQLIPQAGIDFSSNDCLGLASSGLLADAARDALDQGVPLGSGGSRLLRGNHAAHEALEAEAVAIFGCEAALAFSSGYAANTCLFSTLPQKDDVILYDMLVHASAHEGMRLSRAQTRSVRHNDVQGFADAIKDWRNAGGTGTIWIAVESLYSMDGDVAPIDELATLADQNQAMFLIDEAHATGVYGANGLGLAGHLEGRCNVITLRTLGKALGCEGALICGPTICRDFLVNRGRSFIFSTAPSPFMAAVARVALQTMAKQPDRRDLLWQRVRYAEALFGSLGIAASGSQIIPIIIGNDRRAMVAAQFLQTAGFDVRGIRPPTVSEGTSRLRVSITLNVSEADIIALATTLAAVLA